MRGFESLPIQKGSPARGLIGEAGPPPAPNQERLLPPRHEWTGLPQAEVSVKVTSE